MTPPKKSEIDWHAANDWSPKNMFRGNWWLPFSMALQKWKATLAIGLGSLTDNDILIIFGQIIYIKSSFNIKFIIYKSLYSNHLLTFIIDDFNFLWLIFFCLFFELSWLNFENSTQIKLSCTLLWLSIFHEFIFFRSMFLALSHDNMVWTRFIRFNFIQNPKLFQLSRFLRLMDPITFAFVWKTYSFVSLHLVETFFM